jgi:hypothetical protein
MLTTFTNICLQVFAGVCKCSTVCPTQQPARNRGGWLWVRSNRARTGGVTSQPARFQPGCAPVGAYVHNRPGSGPVGPVPGRNRGGNSTTAPVPARLARFRPGTGGGTSQPPRFRGGWLGSRLSGYLQGYRPGSGVVQIGQNGDASKLMRTLLGVKHVDGLDGFPTS